MRRATQSEQAPSRIHLSAPDMSTVERDMLLAAFDANWVAPAGPDLTAFEEEFGAALGHSHAVALSSGTAGLHLALVVMGVGPGDVVIVPSFTFAATANAVHYVGAEPWFVDSETVTWNLDADRVAEAIAAADAAGRHVGAVVSVDLYGQCADHDAVRAVCDPRGIPLVEDAAEAVGAEWEGRPAGSFGDLGVFSFNGNKAMTTGGGGLVVGTDPTVIERIRHLATQARRPVRHYEHTEIGFNYRLSNLLAAVGRGQLRRLPEMLARRAHTRARYEAALGELPGVSFNPIDARGLPNHWLTVVVLGDDATCDRDALIDALEAVDVESRPAWKPMHLQPVHVGAPMFGGAVAEAAFARGVCLPSGSSMTDADVDRVIEAAAGALAR